MNAFDYVNRHYGLSVKRGSRVEYTGNQKFGVRIGKVVSAAGGYINIRFDDDPGKIVGPFHPTWEMRYLESEPTP